jgi:hypothetical protein
MPTSYSFVCRSECVMTDRQTDKPPQSPLVYNSCKTFSTQCSSRGNRGTQNKQTSLSQSRSSLLVGSASGSKTRPMKSPVSCKPQEWVRPPHAMRSLQHTQQQQTNLFFFFFFFCVFFVSILKQDANAESYRQSDRRTAVSRALFEP